MEASEIDRIMMARTGAARGRSCSRACFDAWHDDCGLIGCRCRCHYVTPGQLRALIALNNREAATLARGGSTDEERNDEQ